MLGPEVANWESCVGRGRSLRDTEAPVVAQCSFPKVSIKIKEL